MAKRSKPPIVVYRLQGHRGPAAAAPKIAVTKEPVSVLTSPPLKNKSDGRRLAGFS